MGIGEPKMPNGEIKKEIQAGEEEFRETRARAEAEKLAIPTAEVMDALAKVSDKKLIEAFDYFRENNIRPDSIAFGSNRTKDDKLEAALCLLGVDKGGVYGDQRYELTEYEIVP